MDIYRLKDDTYYWNGSVTDGDSSGISDKWQFTVGALPDTCDCPASGNWAMDCSDTCDPLTANCDKQGNNISFYNAGNRYFDANITNVNYAFHDGSACFFHFTEGNSIVYS